MRVGEIRTLRWSYIDWKNKFIRLPEKVVKEGKFKNIPINHNVEKVLKSLKPSLRVVDDRYHDFVFTYRGKPLVSTHCVRKSFMAACKDAKIPYGEKAAGLIFKDFRRSVKTNMVEAGIDKVYRDKILGHSLKGMDIHYIKPTEEALSEAVNGRLKVSHFRS